MKDIHRIYLKSQIKRRIKHFRTTEKTDLKTYLLENIMELLTEIRKYDTFKKNVLNNGFVLFDRENTSVSEKKRYDVHCFHSEGQSFLENLRYKNYETQIYKHWFIFPKCRHKGWHDGNVLFIKEL